MYKAKKDDLEKIISTYLDAFRDYPKLSYVFPKEEDRLAALEATIRYYVSFDLHYGTAISTDDKLNDAVLFLRSEDAVYTVERHRKAGSYSKKYKDVLSHLTISQCEDRKALFDELDELEKSLDIPKPHMYVDFLGVGSKYQNQGRGHRLISHVIDVAQQADLPIMLFTNTPEDVKFYKGMGFDVLGHTFSERFRFDNVYMLRQAQK